MTHATSVVHVENDQVIVTEWTFKPGAKTGHHTHGHDYVIVPITAGVLRLIDAEGHKDVEIKPGSSYFKSTGVSHDVVNLSDHELRFVEVELK
ncbi:cupin domain-containing protein [Paraburkholderia sp. 1N]|uniref:Cupin domain-containing protein n=1 Tax=Paraburkholderia solitsugae TaxID=2675748 RepID=A0ABX2BY21_9BURK|nr:cupin domain-containing protein [Paraburkholderia solitsugae]NPT45740.1 cupin domain-containing protein [Paraburkholderia solitsugae]